MKFGVLMRPQDPPNAENIVERWQEVLKAAEVAEESGFDGVFLPEHHMLPDGYPPNPIVGCAAIAGRTSQLEVGTTIHLLPFYHPIQTAEAAALVDVISNGGMRLGVGLGNFEPEFELFGLDKGTQVSRFEESIELIKRAWNGESFDHDGRHFQVKGSKITPQPVGAELWMGAMSEPGVERAARFACPWVTDPLHNVAVLKHWAEHYRREGERQGTTDKLQIVLQRDAWVADEMDEIERTWWPHARSDHWFYFEQVPRWVTELEPLLEGVQGEEDFLFENHHVDRLIVGDAEQCIRKIEMFKRELSMDYLYMTFRFATGPSHEKELECIRRFGREVIPAFR